MTVIRNSNLEPSIIIEANTENLAINVDSALARIKNTDSGSSLLKAIEKNSTQDKRVTIHKTNWDMNNTIPTLTQKQLKKHNERIFLDHETQETFARKLSLKKKFTKGDGANALVNYHSGVIDYCSKGHELFIPINPDGINGGFPNNDMTLFKYLVHAMRIIKGTYTDDLTEDGHDDEEMRAIGTGKYADEDISENRFRQERGYPLRGYYLESSNVNNTHTTSRPGLI